MKVALMRFAVLYVLFCCFFWNSPNYHTSLARLNELNLNQRVATVWNESPIFGRHLIDLEGGSGGSSHYGEEETSHAEETSHGESSHGDDGGHGSVSIFGSLVMIDTQVYTTMIIIIVGMVLFIEHLFIGFHEMSMDTPFHHMINAIEQELMIVGCTAFIFKVFLNTNSLVDHDTFFALEFAGKSLFAL